MAKSDNNQTTPPDFAAENAELRTQLMAKDAQQEQILDYLAELKAKVETLESNQTVAPGVVVDEKAAAAAKATAELDAEWAQLAEEFADYPAINVAEARVLAGTEATIDIRLSDEPGMMIDPNGVNRKWKLRWFNFAIEGRSRQAAAEGYIKVKRTELQDADSIPALDKMADDVRIGLNGTEVLHKMPLKLFTYKKKRDAARSAGLLTSESAMRDHLANNVARMAGNAGDSADQAGSMIHGKGFHVDIKKGAPETISFGS